MYFISSEEVVTLNVVSLTWQLGRAVLEAVTVAHALIVWALVSSL